MSDKELMIILEEMTFQIKKLGNITSKLLSLETMLGSVFQVLSSERTPIIKKAEGKLVKNVIAEVIKINNNLSDIVQKLEGCMDKVRYLSEASR